MTRSPRTRPTLEEVAARAGVGRGTASRVINGGEKVSAKSRQAVEDAIAELGYVPNANARALVTRRTDAVALVIAESEARVFGEPFFAGTIRGIGSALAEADRQLVLLFAQASERRGGLDDYLTRQHVDGVLLLSLHDDDQLPDRIRAHGLPVVVGGRAHESVLSGFVDVDNVQGAELAVGAPRRARPQPDRHHRRSRRHGRRLLALPGVRRRAGGGRSAARRAARRTRGLRPGERRRGDAHPARARTRASTRSSAPTT